ncbi:MAG TPA: PqqD family protein [Bryobacteraceae bacterium]|nr:PqqD family protein [Bryobacteraceae bacterium]
MNPTARKSDLTIETLAGETVVYDTKYHKAHCLNSMAARVWQYCDGTNSVADITRRLKEDYASADEEVVQTALLRLQKANLLGTEYAVPSRRDMAKTLSLRAALAVPLISSVAIPTAAAAKSKDKKDKKNRTK